VSFILIYSTDSREQDAVGGLTNSFTDVSHVSLSL